MIPEEMIALSNLRMDGNYRQTIEERMCIKPQSEREMNACRHSHHQFMNGEGDS